MMIDLLDKHIANLFESFEWSAYDTSFIKPYLRDQTDCNLSKKSLELPLLIPKMLIELTQLIRDDSVSTVLRALAGGIYSYVFNPFDYINEESVGFLGLIDDVLIVFYGMQLIEALGKNECFPIVHEQDLQEAVKQWENVLSKEIVLAFKAYPRQVGGILATDLSKAECS